MKGWLIAVLRWLLRWLDPPPSDPVVATARELVAWGHTFGPGTSGEYRRHVVLARLRKAHPLERGRRLSMLIEQVLAE